MKYMIYTIEHWTKLPVRNPLISGKWFHFDGKPNYETNDINNALKVLKENYADKVYKTPKDDGTECLLFYVINSCGEVIATLDFDGNVLISEK